VQAILFEHRHAEAGFRVLGAVKDEVTVARPDFSYGKSQGKVEIMAELERTLVKQGLYPKEAAAMIKTWNDSWFEEGLRLFYFVPRAAADAILRSRSTRSRRSWCGCSWAAPKILTPEMEQARSRA